MKSKVLLFVFVFAGFSFAQAVMAAEPAAATKKPAETKKTAVAVKKPAAAVQQSAAISKGPYAAPGFELQDIYQDMVSLSDYKNNQPVILFFWTTWCPFCQKELSVLKNMKPELTKNGVELLAINVGELPDKVTNAVNSMHLSFRVLLDKDTTVSLKYKVVGVPTYVLINKEGNVVYQDNSFPSGYQEMVK